MASTARALRDEINQAGPDLTVGLAWGFPCWTGSERIVSIIAHKAHCNLQLWSGARMAKDFPGLIEGTGKQLRHVKISNPDGITPEIRKIIKAAIKLDATSPERVR